MYLCFYKKIYIIFIVVLLFTTNCSQKTSGTKTNNSQANRKTNTSTTLQKPMKITKEAFGKTQEGTPVDLFTLTNGNGITVKLTNYGGIITSIITPDKNGQPGDIVLGADKLDDYLKGHPFLGNIVGRFGNRIAKGKFNLNGKTYQLAVNNGENHIHGGLKGFDKKVWKAEEVKDAKSVGVKLSYVSPDGEEGYPGNLATTVTYTLNKNNELTITYEATTDKTTPINLTNHSYFNLAAGKAENVLSHEVKINADKFVAVNDKLIPTGELKPVANSPMDFTSKHVIGERIEKVPGGYDHTYVLNKEGDKDKPSFAAWVHEPTSGRVLEVFTTQPGVQFYTGNFLNGEFIGKNNKAYVKHYGFCLETQHFPDSPNQPSFPSTWLHPGEKFSEVTTFKFSTKEM